jgi:hypothetical protein
MNFAAVEKIASALLYEGYILYPYRPNAIKNRQRWNFGTLYPRIYAEAQRPQEPFRFIAECLLLPGQNASLHIKLSFLQLVPHAPAAGEALHHPIDLSLDWDEAVERVSEYHDLSIASLLASPLETRIDPEPGLEARLTVKTETLSSGACKLHLQLQNGSPLLIGPDARRDEALTQSLVSAHLLLGITGGEFLSLLEPAEGFIADAQSCTNTGVFPVLAGNQPDRSMLLISPIILYDYPQTAPESRGDFFDGTEMDEMLTLRVLTLTDEEKQQMRFGDPRARRLLERTEAITSEEMLEAHGVIRALRGDGPANSSGDLP